MRYVLLLLVLSGCLPPDDVMMKRLSSVEKELKVTKEAIINANYARTEVVDSKFAAIESKPDTITPRIQKIEDAQTKDGLKDDMTIGDLKLRLGNLEEENKGLRAKLESFGEDIADIHGDTRTEALDKRIECLETLTASLQEELTALKDKGLKSKQPTESVPPVQSPKAAYSIQQGRSTRGIVLTGKNCVWCRQLENNSFPALRSTNWSIGPDNTNNIEVVDIDTEKGNAYLAEMGLNRDGVAFGIPTLVRVVNGKVVSYHTGYLSAKELSGFFNGTFTPPAVVIRAKEKVA